MKKAISIIGAAVLFAAAAKAQNPISPMGVYIPDPSARVFNGRWMPLAPACCTETFRSDWIPLRVRSSA